MIETMNEWHEQFVSDMTEFSLLHKAYRSLSFFRFEASLYDDCVSSLFLESNVVDDAHSIDLEVELTFNFLAICYSILF